MNRIDWIGDRRLFVLSLILLGSGVIAVYGATSWQAVQRGGSDWSVVSGHVTRLLLGLLAAIGMAVAPYRMSARIAALVGLPLSIALLAVVAVGGRFVASSAGIERWLSLLGLSIQPVDLAKLSLVLALPWWIERRPQTVHSLRGLTTALAPVLVVFLLLALQPNFGSILALGLIVLTIFYLAGLPTRWIVLAGVVSLALMWLAYAHSAKVHGRVDAWLALLIEGRSIGDESFQPLQALVAIGSGGMFGEGVGASTMKFSFLPECDTDFVFAILGEELGFVGALALLAVFGLWYGRVLKIAHQSPDGLAYLLACGLGSMIFVYALLNLLMVTAIMPVAGLPLPFISRGGSALVTNMAGVGVLLNIARTARRRHSPSDRWGAMPL